MKNKPFTIEQLIKHLSIFPKDTLVGKIGHFGEFHEMDKSDFDFSHSYRDHQYKETESLNVIDINIPYIGEEPD
jgi:hypothetical protein